MAITIYAGTVSKKKNSTYQPTGLTTSYSVVLKDGCSENSPVFVLNAGSFPYNYITWDTNYYFVTDVTYVRNNLIEIKCELDVLATFKTSILNSSHFVLYDTTANTEITDDRLSISTSATYAENTTEYPWDFLGTGYCVVINVIGKTKCTSYAMSMDSASSLMAGVQNWREDLFPSITTPSVEVEDVQTAIQYLSNLFKQISTNITESVRQLASNDSAGSCIKSAYIIPIDYSHMFGTVVDHIDLGSYEATVTAKELTHISFQDAEAVAIPWQSTDWRRNSPYTQIYLYIPFIGVINIPASQVIGWTNIRVALAMDFRTGEAVFTVCKEITDEKAIGVIGQYSATLSGDFAIGSSQPTAKQLAGMVGSAAAGIGASLFGGPVGMAAGAAAIKGMFNNAQAVPTSVGSVGGGAITSMFGTDLRCFVVYHDTNVTPSSVSPAIGTPTMAYKSLSSLTGFVQCSNAKVAAPAHGDELDKIDNYLNSGFFIE